MAIVQTVERRWFKLWNGDSSDYGKAMVQTMERRWFRLWKGDGSDYGKAMVQVPIEWSGEGVKNGHSIVCGMAMAQDYGMAMVQTVERPFHCL